MKICVSCKETKPTSEFYKSGWVKDGFRSRCKLCEADERRAQIWKNQGIIFTIEEYQALMDRQEGRCAVCQELSTRTLCVDHDHISGKVRGLLCHDCNTGIGKLKEDVKILSRAIQYLTV